MTRPLIVIAGPTAAGKSALAVQLAKRIEGSIISADSMQVYRGMDIGSAKITPTEMDCIPHYLIDIIEPDEKWNVTEFAGRAKSAMQEIYAQGRVPMIVGGTGFYIQSVVYDIDFTEQEEDSAFRHTLEAYAAENGALALHQKLAEVDPQAAAEIHPNNIKRVVRAIEYYHESGERISDHNHAERQKQSPYDTTYFVLTDERDKLYARIDRRVDQMIQDGLVDEVKMLRDRGYHRGMVSMQGLGYKEILAYLDGDLTLDEAIYIIKRDTRHFAKRQLTWFRREKNVIWINRSEFPDDEAILKFMQDNIIL